jgi:tetratricopeptide (TPR) repeat protein
MGTSIELLMQQGEAYVRETKFAEARSTFAEALERVEAEHGPEAPELVAPLMWLAKATGEGFPEPCEQLEEQLAIEERALAIATAKLANDPALAHYLYTHGISLWLGRRREEAEAVLRRAVAKASATGVEGSLYEGALAELLLDVGRPQEALVYARRSYRGNDSGNEDVMGVYRLGLCLRETGPRDEAREVLGRFLAACPEADPELLERVAGWIRDLS